MLRGVVRVIFDFTLLSPTLSAYNTHMWSYFSQTGGIVDPSILTLSQSSWKTNTCVPLDKNTMLAWLKSIHMKVFFRHEIIHFWEEKILFSKEPGRSLIFTGSDRSSLRYHAPQQVQGTTRPLSVSFLIHTSEKNLTAKQARLLAPPTF